MSQNVNVPGANVIEPPFLDEQTAVRPGRERPESPRLSHQHRVRPAGDGRQWGAQRLLDGQRGRSRTVADHRAGIDEGRVGQHPGDVGADADHHVVGFGVGAVRHRDELAEAQASSRVGGADAGRDGGVVVHLHVACDQERCARAVADRDRGAGRRHRGGGVLVVEDGAQPWTRKFTFSA